jgi:hypothetical protein
MHEIKRVANESTSRREYRGGWPSQLWQSLTSQAVRMLNALLSLPIAAGEDSSLAKTFGVWSSELRRDPVCFPLFDNAHRHVWTIFRWTTEHCSV